MNRKIVSLLLIVATMNGVALLAAQESVVNVRIALGIKDKELKEMMENNASTLLTACNKAVKESKKPKIPKEIITDETRKKLDLIWKMSRILCTVSDFKSVCNTASSGEYQIRGIPVQLLSADQQYKDEKLSLHFNDLGQISDISINVIDFQALDDSLAGGSEDESEQQEEKPDTAKTSDVVLNNLTEADAKNLHKIFDFIEKLRTAYNCKDINYLENIYSNNALIINAVKKTIRQVENTNSVINSINLQSYGYDYQIRTKREYLDKLALVFKKNRFVNISFDSVRVEAHPGYSNLYGVTLYQKWNASLYRDEGFLYLMIDCRKEYEMMIFVRAWAPEQIFNFNSFSDIRFLKELN